MSTVAVSYRSLRDASGEANSVARKLDSYADSLDRNVLRKLNNYNGDWSDNMNMARNSTGNKINALRSMAQDYRTYATNLRELKDECEGVDRAVRSDISRLTASFKASHGIRNSVIENTFSYFFTSVDNSSSFGRWLNNQDDKFDAAKDYLKDSIKEWYNYKGGKELLKGALVAALEIAIAVAGLVTGGSAFAIIAGVIALVNGVFNLVNEFRAYDYQMDNYDPATARRISKEDTVQDYLRDGDITDEDNSGWLNNHVRMGRLIATGIDVVNIICAIGSLFHDFTKLLKNGFKWATGHSMNSWTDIFSGEFFSGLGSKIKAGFTDLSMTIKLHDWSAFVDFGKRILFDFKENLAQRFQFGGEDSAKTAKNYFSLAKSLIKGDFTFGTFVETAIKNIFIPCFTVFTVTNDDPQIKTGRDGQMYIDMIEKITIKDFTGIVDDIDSKVIDSPLFDSEAIDISVLHKMTHLDIVDIAVPDIEVPDISMPQITYAAA